MWPMSKVVGADQLAEHELLRVKVLRGSRPTGRRVKQALAPQGPLVPVVSAR